MKNTKETRKRTTFVTIVGGEQIVDISTLTHWGDPNEVVPHSGYGHIIYRHWCEREMARINRRGDGVRIVTRVGGDMDGHIALRRNQWEAGPGK